MKTSVILSVISLAVSAQAIEDPTWTRCTNAPRCTSTSAPGGPTTEGTSVTFGSGTIFPGSFIFPYQATSGFTYDESDGYWYSHDVDGEYISPLGYLNFAHGYNLVGIQSKNGSIGSSYWNGMAKPCCLPDIIGTNIYNVYSYDIGYA